MDNQTLALISEDFTIAIKALRVLAMTKHVIAELDKQNRIRHMQKLPKINYDPLYCESLVNACCGNDCAKSGIIERLIRSALDVEVKKS
jgi:hypothetical protein